jgi:hypothetical protein
VIRVPASSYGIAQPPSDETTLVAAESFFPDIAHVAQCRLNRIKLHTRFDRGRIEKHLRPEGDSADISPSEVEPVAIEACISAIHQFRHIRNAVCSTVAGLTMCQRHQLGMLCKYDLARIDL